MEWLKRMREDAKLTQEQLAELTGIDRSMISKLETGSAVPSPKTAQAIANVLDFDWTRFFESEQAAS